MTKWEVKEGTLGGEKFLKGECPNGDGGILKRKRCQTCFRLWEFRSIATLKKPEGN